MTKKRTLAIALAICMIAILGMSTLAYFQYEKTVTNYFAVAGVEDPTDPDATVDPDDLFSITLEETDNDPEDPENPGKTDEGNTYEDILPGMTVTKDPTVTNTGSYGAWIRVIVTVTDAKDWKAACAKHEITDLTHIFGGYDEALWTRGEIIDDTDDDTLTYVYYLDSVLGVDESACLFETVTIPEEFDIEDMASLATFSIEISAQAIQSDNNGTTAQEGFSVWEDPTSNTPVAP